MTADEKRRGNGQGYGSPPAGFESLDQAFDRDSLYALRAAVGAHAAAAGLAAHRVYDVVAAAHELAANAVVHGAGTGRLRLWTDGQSLYCQVSDDGQAGAAGGNDPAGSAAPWPAEHGHGLWLVGQVATHIRIGHGPAGTTATVRFSLDQD